ncbi:MAG TPA: hypothetical protein VFV50_19030, partial [Bdellovibrionales bacterium]|nr:hypothetical protein [Bdellovibrionales bacterium]
MLNESHALFDLIAEELESSIPKSRIDRIHEEALGAAREYRRAETKLLRVLQDVDICRAYLHLGAKSLFEYCTTLLGLSESVAYNFITVSRKAREVPKLQDEIESGRLSVSMARKIAPVLTPENQEHWIERAKTQTQKELEREVAKVSPAKAKRERRR